MKTLGTALLLAAASLSFGPALYAQHFVAPAADVEAGVQQFQQMCGACHGARGGGGPGGAANLTRSAIANADDGGATLHAFLQTGRPEKGMPPFPLSREQAAGLAAAMRSFAPDASAASGQSEDDIVLVGDAAAGRAFFNGPVGQCGTCHSTVPGELASATNLAQVASRYDSIKDMQNAMVLNRSFFWSPAMNNDVAATITFADGRVATGFLTSVSDFKVVIHDQNGRESEFARNRGEPRVELEDRLQHHLDLLEIYRDEDIHNLTAYLATLR